MAFSMRGGDEGRMGYCGATACVGGGDGESIMTYIGGSRGAYVQEISYKFVGEGEGEFDLVEVGGGFKPRLFIGMFGVAACFVLLLIGVLVWPGRIISTTTPKPFDPYDCAAGYANWEKGWSAPGGRTGETLRLTPRRIGAATTKAEVAPRRRGLQPRGLPRPLRLPSIAPSWRSPLGLRPRRRIAAIRSAKAAPGRHLLRLRLRLRRLLRRRRRRCRSIATLVS